MSHVVPMTCPPALTNWLSKARDNVASDLHLVSGSRPIIRAHGMLHTIDDAMLESNVLRDCLKAVCPEDMWARFESELNIDFSLNVQLPGAAQRVRANYFVADRQPGACFRLIPESIPTLAWANFPAETALKLASFRNGLVILSGVTGSGKSTTLAMIIDMLNAEGHRRIVTIEEPVEYVFPTRENSIVTQREIGLDVHSFADGLKYALRQDPDIILVGEIRDYETAQMALTAAETGLLVFSTLHARDAKGVISRFCDLYPNDAQQEVRSQLAGSLRAIVGQHLISSAIPGEKRRLALEIMYNTGPISSGIRSGKLQSLDNTILTGRDEGMICFDESVRRLVASGEIDHDVATRFVSDPSVLGW